MTPVLRYEPVYCLALVKGYFKSIILTAIAIHNLPQNTSLSVAETELTSKDGEADNWHNVHVVTGSEMSLKVFYCHTYLYNFL